MAPGLGRLHFEDALRELCGREVSSEGVAFAGRTDRSLAREMLLRAGYESGLETAIDDVLEAYAHRVEEGIEPRDVTILPGVVDLLAALATNADLHLGVLTGNLERTGRAKLEAAALGGFFGFGAWGSDHEDRNQLPVFARDRAEVALGRQVPFETLVIIGDTEHDVACGRAVGARTVAVSTGWVSREALAETHPDLLLDDLTDSDTLHSFLSG